MIGDFSFDEPKKKQFFKDQLDAGRKLYDLLPIDILKKEQWKLVALSHNALYVILALNKTLHLEYDRLFIEAIYSPNNSECEIAMVSEKEEIVIHDSLVESFDIQNDYIYGEAHRKYEDEILSSIYNMRKGQSFIDVRNEHVLLIDIGTETGLSLMTGIKTMFNLGAKSVSIAYPVIAKDLYDDLQSIVDNAFALHVIPDYINARFYYETILKVGSDEVEEILEQKDRHG